VLAHIAGVLKALRTAYDSGYLATVTELIHADVFADFVEMAKHLLSEGYKDPAAVIIGSTLEEHLRQLCVKNGIATDVGRKPTKADQLNSELGGQGIYSKLDQKTVTAWLLENIVRMQPGKIVNRYRVWSQVPGWSRESE
jgi:hypothetical protein